jgi:D-alanyl-D-alanine carboxypeptidase/D-alanyl-D-alanine-endopeptidase (penicillin-binding protein 4)
MLSVLARTVAGSWTTSGTASRRAATGTRDSGARRGSRAAAALAFAASLTLASTAWAQSLNDDVQRLINKGRFGQATVGVSIVDVDTGTTLAGVRASQGLIPASNQKLVTSAAALQVLRPDFAFRTELVLKDGVLIVRGGGDPALGDPEVLRRSEPPLSVESVLDALAIAAERGNARTVRELVVDDRVFDRTYIHPDWPARNFSQPHSAQVAGVNFRANTLAVFPRPSPDGVGTTALYAMEPLAPWIRIDNRARTVGQGQNTIGFSREIGTNNFVLTGSVRFASKAPIEATIDTPPLFFGQVLAAHMAKRGITIGDDSTSARGEAPQGVRLANADEDLTGGTVLAVVSTPLSEVLLRCNADSENLFAEALVKRMGREVSGEPGSWANGTAVIRMVLSQRVGVERTAATVVADGSGISRENLISPATLTRLLDVMASDDALREHYLSSLAQPGSGTLRQRFSGNRLKNQLHAKSGFINGVRTLSGYVVDPDSDRTVAFSVMVNNITTGEQTTAAMTLHEDVVRLVDSYLSARAKAQPPRQGG